MTSGVTYAVDDTVSRMSTFEVANGRGRQSGLRTSPVPGASGRLDREKKGGDPWKP